MVFRFEPGREQAQALARRVRLSLADSLEHIASRAAGILDFDFALLAAVAWSMRSGARYPCSTFALYADIVVAIRDGDELRATRLLEELVREEPLAVPWRIEPLDSPVHARHRERFLRFMNSDPRADFFMGPPPADVAAAFTARLLRARARMGEAMPGLAEEFDTIVSDVVLVVDDDSAAFQFDGGSSYLQWGGLFLNATSHETDVAMVEVLAHESAHILLYAASADEALVTNPDDELFSSPLRRDRRPMDGIFHATFVSARMHWAMGELAKHPALRAEDRERALAERESDRRNFWAGHGVVAEHGRLTPTGRDVMDAARRYMESAGPAA